MEARELRIGNLHEIEGIEIPRLGISSIKVDGKSYARITGYGIQLVEEGTLDFKPIPITEEWLLKLGFMSTSNNWYEIGYMSDCDEAAEWMVLSINTNTLRCATYDSDGSLPVYTKKRLEYIHQLQNLYFALTGEDLEVMNEG